MQKILINPDGYDMENAEWPTVRFAFDLDSVLAETTLLEQCLEERFGELIVDGPYRTFKLDYVNLPDDKSLYNAIREIQMLHSTNEYGTPYMLDVLRYLHELSGEPIAVVTARHRDCLEVTDTWLRNNLGELPWICAICHGTPKLNVLSNLMVEYFVDDRYKTIFGLQGYIKNPIQYIRPWNIGRGMPASRLRIRDLRDLIPLINIEFGYPPVNWPGNIAYPDVVGYKSGGY